MLSLILVAVLLVVCLIIGIGVGFGAARWFPTWPKPSTAPKSADAEEDLRRILVVAGTSEAALAPAGFASAGNLAPGLAWPPRTPRKVTDDSEESVNPHQTPAVTPFAPLAAPSPARNLGGMLRAASQALDDWESRSVMHRLASADSCLFGAFPSSPLFHPLLTPAPAALLSPAPEDAASAPLPAGEIHLDEITLLEKVGGGAFGYVWKGQWRGAPVAVKYIVTRTDSSACLGRAIREVVLSKKLTHPNVVQTFTWTVLSQPEQEDAPVGEPGGALAVAAGGGANRKDIFSAAAFSTKTKAAGSPAAADDQGIRALWSKPAQQQEVESSPCGLEQPVGEAKPVAHRSIFSEPRSTLFVGQSSATEAWASGDAEASAELATELPTSISNAESIMAEVPALPRVRVKPPQRLRSGNSASAAVTPETSYQQEGDGVAAAPRSSGSLSSQCGIKRRRTSEGSALSGGSGCTVQEELAPRMDSFNSEEGFGSPVKRTRGGVQSVFALEGLQLQEQQALLVICLEHCDLGSLHRALRRRAFIPSAKWPFAATYRALLRTAAEIAIGMEYMHAHSICHGDLKPANVLLKTHRADRRGYVAKVADFGLSRHIADVQVTDGVGTIAYAAPETLSGDIGGKAADVFAFGILLYALYHCAEPYEGLLEAQICMGVADGALRPEWQPGCPLPYRALAERCWNQDPALRPTFADISQELVSIEMEFRSKRWQRRKERSNGGSQVHCPSNRRAGSSLMHCQPLTTN